MQSPQIHIRKAFTLVELLVVVAIIGILIGIAFVGAKSYMATQRANATRQTLGNLKSMLGELENANGLKNSPGFWLWWDSGAIITSPKTGAVAGTSVDFWKYPFPLGNAVPTTAAPGYAPLVGPSDVSTGDVNNEIANQRFASIAVVNTMLAMAQINALPVNKTRLQSLPGSVVTTLEIQQDFTSGKVLTAGDDSWINWGNTATPTDVQFEPGMHIRKKDNTGKLHSYVAITNSTIAPISPANWKDETFYASGVPILLDAWNNPIIFVPATGLTVLLKNGHDKYGYLETPAMSYPEQRFIIISPEGQVANNGTTNAGQTPTVIRPGRPFWASAGPDGDFSKGDDNVYSFEQ